MYVFVNARNFPDAGKYLEAFESIYLEAFPNPSEQEPYPHILERIQNPPAGPSPETYAVLLIEDETVLGGMIADWYPAASSLEIIYIAICSGARRRGFGSALLKGGLKEIKKNLRGVKYVFFESENPMDPENLESEGGMDPVRRLWFFANAGAMRIPVDYVQPPLKAGGDFASNMFLFILPGKGRDKMPSEHLAGFLEAFYDGLKGEAVGQEDRWEYELAKMKAQIERVEDEKGDVRFDHLKETPHFTFDKVSVAGHFLMDGKPSDSFSKESLGTCPVFHSYETDLMDYSHQGEDRPFVTHFKTIDCGVLLHLPGCYRYTSEGESYFRLVNSDPLVVDVSTDWSFRPDTGEVLAHLVLCPSEGYSFTELDFIRLVTAFGSKQEEYQALSPERTIATKGWSAFRLSTGTKDKPLLTSEEWISSKLGEGTFHMEGSGISDLNMEGTTLDGELLFGSFGDFLDSVPKASLWNRTLCGMLLGIFDFERMNSPEVYDTIQPMVKRSDSFCLLSRGHLMKLSLQDDEEYERVDNILISPYLLIPSAALAFNEILLRDSQKHLDGADEGSVREPSALIKFFTDRWYMARGRRLQKICTDVNKALTDLYLDGFFQYGSEQELLHTGGERRGLDKKINLLRRKLGNLKAEADGYQQNYEDGMSTNENMILLVLAILQVVTALFHEGQEWWLITTSLILVAVFLVVGRGRLNRKRKD